MRIQHSQEEEHMPSLGGCQRLTSRQNREETEMSAKKIVLTYHVESEVGVANDSLTPARIEEVSAEQSIFLCRALFYLLRQVTIGADHNPLFKSAEFLHALEAISQLGEAISNTAYDHVEQLSRLERQAVSPVKRATKPTKR